MWKALAFAACAVLAAPAVAADTINVTRYDWVPGLVLGDIHYQPGAPGTNYPLIKGGVGIGQFQLDGTRGGQATSLFTFCIDIFDDIDVGTYQFVSLSSLVSDAGKRDQLAKLLGYTAPLLNGASGADAINISAATQLAIWEILNESSGSYSLAGGDFFVTGDTLAADQQAALDTTRALGQGYLDFVTSGQSGPRARLGALYAPQLQAQVFVGGVPEPATWAVMILGFGAVGAAVRRRVNRYGARVHRASRS